MGSDAYLVPGQPHEDQIFRLKKNNLRLSAQSRNERAYRLGPVLIHQTDSL